MRERGESLAREGEGGVSKEESLAMGSHGRGVLITFTCEESLAREQGVSCEGARSLSRGVSRDGSLAMGLSRGVSSFSRKESLARGLSQGVSSLSRKESLARGLSRGISSDVYRRQIMVVLINIKNEQNNY